MAPRKPGQLLLQAFKAMQEPQGLTVTQIIKFYSRMHDVPLSRATLAVQRALRMGLATGFVDKKRNRFMLGTEDGDKATLLPAPADATNAPAPAPAPRSDPLPDANGPAGGDPSRQLLPPRKRRRRRGYKTKEMPRYHRTHRLLYRRKHEYNDRPQWGLRRPRRPSPEEQSDEGDEGEEVCSHCRDYSHEGDGDRSHSDTPQ